MVAAQPVHQHAERSPARQPTGHRRAIRSGHRRPASRDAAGPCTRAAERANTRGRAFEHAPNAASGVAQTAERGKSACKRAERSFGKSRQQVATANIISGCRRSNNKSAGDTQVGRRLILRRAGCLVLVSRISFRAQYDFRIGFRTALATPETPADRFPTVAFGPPRASSILGRQVGRSGDRLHFPIADRHSARRRRPRARFWPVRERSTAALCCRSCRDRAGTPRRPCRRRRSAWRSGPRTA